MVDIYALTHPETGEIRYIGKANCAQKRLKTHMRDARRRRTPVYDWINSIASTPGVTVLRVCGGDWPEVEREEIAKARAAGVRLLNLADGGDEPLCSPETRSKNGFALAARIRNDPEFAMIASYKRRLGWALKNGYLMNKTRAKMREAARLNPAMFGSWANIPDDPNMCDD